VPPQSSMTWENSPMHLPNICELAFKAKKMGC